VGIKHKKTATYPDGTDPGLEHPSDWNDTHDADGVIGKLLPVADVPSAFPYIQADGSGAMAPISAPALAALAQATAALILSALGGVTSSSPTLTGTPRAPQPAPTDNSDQIATTQFVKNRVADLVAAAPTTLDTLSELATALGNDPNFSATITAALGFRLRVDAAQGLSSPQKAQGVANLGLATVAVSGNYADLAGRPTLGTAAALNVGTGASQVVQLDGSAKLPAVDGSQLTNVIASGSLSFAIVQTLTGAQKNQARANAGTVGVVKVQTITASGTYTPSAGMLYCLVETIGGGGGGAGCGAPGATAITFGGGGGSGSYSRKLCSAADIGASKPATIGAGGNGGAIGANNGANGGATSLGTLCTSNGGGGGASTGTPSSGQGGSGGGSGTGDVAMPGNPGTGGTVAGNITGINGLTGQGGNSVLGGTGIAYAVNGFAQIGGNAPAGTGAGGGGAGASFTGAGAAGGNGGSGCIIITEFCSST
jgi:hypothetical protein